MELLMIVIVFVLSVSLAFVGARSVLSIVLYLMMRPALSFHSAHSGTRADAQPGYAAPRHRRPAPRATAQPSLA